MTAGALVFYFLALMVLLPAVYVATTRNVVRAAFALILAFFGMAGLFAYLGADFLAGTQMLVYAGGILVLLLFGVMLTQHALALELPGKPARILPAALITLGIVAALTAVVVKTIWAVGPTREPRPTTLEIGQQLLTRFVIPFEAASVLLLAVMVGAALVARRDAGGRQ